MAHPRKVKGGRNKTVPWKAYEAQIIAELSRAYRGSTIRGNVKLPGRYSKTQRQVDVLIQGQIAAATLQIIVEAKAFRNRIDVKGVEAFLGMLADLGAHKGVMVSQRGYSKAALSRASNDPADVELDILSLAQLRRWQGVVAIPYVGKHAFVLVAPFGWVVDIQAAREKDCLAVLYQRGLDFKTAQRRTELMYINAWDKERYPMALAELATQQEDHIRSFAPNSTFTRTQRDSRTLIRTAIVETYPVEEITAFIEFEKIILFIVLLTPDEHRSRNLRKLDGIISTIQPTTISFDNTKLIAKLTADLKKQADKAKKAQIAFRIGHLYQEMGDAEKAVKFFRQCQTLAPTYPVLKALLAKYLSLEDLNAAIAAADAFFDLDPTNPTIYNDLIAIFSERHRLSPLTSFLKRKRVASSSNDHIVGSIDFYLGAIELHQGRRESARKRLLAAEKRLRTVLPQAHQVFSAISASLTATQNDEKE